MNDILIELLVPSLGESLDVMIPAVAPMHEITSLLVQAIEKHSQGRFRAKDPILCGCEDGKALPTNASPSTLGLKNGAWLMLL